MSTRLKHRILLTGGSGFLGKQVREEIEKDPDCEGLFLSRQSQPPFEIEKISQDSELTSLKEAILKFEPTCLLHLAWGKVRRSERSDTFHLKENLLASQYLFDFLAKNFPKCRLVGIGSQAELGALNEVMTPESKGQAINAYGEGKSRVRDYLLTKYPRWGVWIRFLTIYGPGDHGEKFIPYLVDCLKNGRDAEISPGEQIWDFLHVSDAARALVAVAKAQQIEGIHILVSGEAWPLKKVAEFLFLQAQIKGKTAALHVGARPYAAVELMRLEGDPESLKVATGWSPKIPLEMGLADIVKNHV